MAKIKDYDLQNSTILNNKFYPFNKDHIEELQDWSKGGNIPTEEYDTDLIAVNSNYGEIDNYPNLGSSNEYGDSLTYISKDGTVEINPKIDNTVKIAANGYARRTPMVNQNDLYEAYDIPHNPSTTNAGFALWHAVMGIHANYDFYRYILKKGYVYKNGFKFQKNSSLATPVPSEWVGPAMYYFGTYPTTLPAPQYWTLPDPALGPVIDSNCNYHPLHDCAKPFTTKKLLYPLGGNQLPSYGTIYSPSCAFDRFDQQDLNTLGSANFMAMKINSDPDFLNVQSFPNITTVAAYSPMDHFSVKPTWCTYWEAISTKDIKNITVIFDDNSVGNAPVPEYQAKIIVSLNSFFNEWLIGNNLIEYKPQEAAALLKELLEPTIAIDIKTGVAKKLAGSGPTNYDGRATGNNVGNFAEIENLLPSPFQQEIIDEIKKRSVVPEDVFNIGKIFDNSTHYINNEVNKIFKNRLLVDRSVLSEYTSYDNNGKARIQRARKYGKDKLTSFELAYGTTVEVIEEFIQGQSGLYHKIRIVDPNDPKFGSKEAFFIKAKLLTKLPDTLPSLNTIFKNYVKTKDKVEWIKMKDEEIFFDRRLLAYSVVIEPKDPLTNKKVDSMLQCSKTVNELENIAMRDGIEALMKCHNKAMFINNNVASTISHLMNNVFQFAYTGDNIVESKKGLSWYLDPRPRSKVKFIVRIPAKYFDALAEKAETFEDIPHYRKQLFTPEGVQPTDAAPAPSTGVSDFRVSTILTCNLKHKIDMATSIMKKYKEQIDAWDGDVEGLDLGLEIERLQAFPQAVQKFVIENKIGYRPNGEDELEIGCNGKFRLKYVSYVKAGLSKPLRICFNKFKRKAPMKYSRTMAYIYYLDEIVELERKLTTGASNQQQMNWIDFVQKYTYPMPAIRPSSRKRTNPLSPNALLDGKENKAEKLAEKLDKQIELTGKALDAQNIEISKPELKLQLANARLQQKDFSGDLFIEQIPQLVDSIRNLSPNFEGLQDLFTLVFDKIDISTLSSIGASSLAFDMPTIDIEGSFALAAIDSPDISGVQFDKIFDFLPEISIGKINLVESYFDGSIPSVALEGEIPDDVLNMILEFYEKKEDKPSPTGREADMMKNGSLEDIKCLGLDTKFGTTSPRLSESQNTRKELVKMIVSPNDLASAIRKVTPDIINAMSEIGELGKKDVPSLSLSPLKKAAVKFPKPPTLTLPKLKDIDDTMPNISKDLTAGLEQILATVLIEISATLLETVFNSVFSSADKLGQSGIDAFPSEFGGQDMNELLEDFKPGTQDAVENALKKLGVGPAVENYDVPIDQIVDEMSKESQGGDSTTQETQKTSKQIISEISSVLTPLEVVDLLEGNPSSETIKIVEAVMGEGNQTFLDSINRVTSVKSLFKSLGKLADSNKLQAIRNTVDEILPNPSGLLCEYENFSTIGEPDSPGDVIRRRALEGKLDKECVETQMTEIRKRKTKRLADMLAVANGKDLLAGAIPPMIGNCGKGLINKNHQTVEHMNEKLMKAIFDPIKMNFSTEANSVVASFSENNMRKPDQYDDQYDALKAALSTAGLSGVENTKDVTEQLIKNGFNGLLASPNATEPSSDQQKFNTAAAPFYVFDGTVAPKVRNLYTKKISFEHPSPQVPVGSNKAMTIKTKYTTMGVSENLTSFEKQKNKVDSLIAQIRNLQKQIDQDAPNKSDLVNEKSQLENLLGDRTDKPGGTTFFAKYNAALEDASKVNADEQIVSTEVDAGFTYFTKDYQNNQPDQILDTWRISIPSNMADKVLALPTKTNTNYNIYGYKEIDDIVPTNAEKYRFYANLNERDQVFANLMKEKWDRAILAAQIDFAPNISDSFNDFYRDKRGKIFNYMVNVFGYESHASKLYDGSGFQELELGSGKGDANFDANGKCDLDKVDNLLGIENLKKQARDEYNNSCDEQTDPSKPSGLEKANLRSLMKGAIRLSILDAVSRGIFVASRYSMKDMLADDALTDFFEEMVKSDLISQDNEYYSQFLIQAKDMTDERQKRGEKLIDPFTGVEDKRVTDTADPRTSMGMNSLRLLIREELSYLAPKIDEKLKPKHKNIDKFFVHNMMPNVDVRRHAEENQYHKIDTESLVDPATGKTITELPANFKIKNEFKFIQPNSSTFGGGGGFVLEKYIRIKDAQISTTRLSSMSKEKKDFLTAWLARPGGINNENAIGVNEIDKIDIGKSKDNSYAYTSGAVNREALVEAIQKTLEASDLESIEIGDMIKEFKFGVRIVYVPPCGDDVSFKGASQSYTGATLSDFTPLYNTDDVLDYELQVDEAIANADELLSSGKNGFDPIYNKRINSPNGDQAKEDAITLISNKEKLFRIREKMGTFTEDFEELAVPFEEGVFEFVGGKISQNITVKTLYPIELVSVEDDYGFLDVLKQENGQINLNDLVGALNDIAATGGIFNALREKLVNDKRYKFIFHYNMPVRRALTLLFIHQNISSVKNYPAVTRSYSITKNMIRSSFFNMIPGDPWWSKQDKRIEEQGGNAGMMETANNTMTADGPSGSDMAMKIAYMAASIICKAMAAQQDPNYSLMKQLDNFNLTPAGMNWKSVPLLYPMNFPLPFPPFIGWGPPMTPLGMVAYSLPALPGESKKNKNKEDNKEEDNSEC